MPEHILCHLDDLAEDHSKGIVVNPASRYADIVLVRTRKGIYAYRNAARIPERRWNGSPTSFWIAPARSFNAASTGAVSHRRRLLRFRPLCPAIATTVELIERDGWLIALDPWSTPVAEPPVIQVENLRKYYGSVRAVDGISFDIARGTTCALLGGNGAGKTTTIAMLLGLLLPSSGRIHILGEEVPRHHHRVLPRMNFSSPYVDLPQRLTVAENLTVYARLYGVPACAKRLAALGRDLDIDAFFQRPLRQLIRRSENPGGTGQGAVERPEILLLDEPTASLDPDTADRMRGILTDHQRRAAARPCYWPPIT